MGDHIVLAASRRILKGEEVTVSYAGMSHESVPLFERQLGILRRYHFECECQGCAGDWPQYDDMPFQLLAVPNFEYERLFVVRTGDKKDLVSSMLFTITLKKQKKPVPFLGPGDRPPEAYG